jgi:hypothetical protein
MKKILASFLVIAAAGAATFVSPISGQTSAPIVIGTAQPSGQGFTVRVDELAIHRANPPAPLNPAGRAAITSDTELTGYVRREAAKKLAEVFPNGVPPAVASRIKITVTVKFTRPPEVGVSVQW